MMDREEILCFIVACTYLSLKVESRITMSFDLFLFQVTKLQSFGDLRGDLAPHSTLYSAMASNYREIEQHLLQQGLNFKIDFVSSAHAIYQIICTFAAITPELRRQERDLAQKTLEPML